MAPKVTKSPKVKYAIRLRLSQEILPDSYSETISGAVQHASNRATLAPTWTVTLVSGTSNWGDYDNSRYQEAEEVISATFDVADPKQALDLFLTTILGVSPKG